MDPERDGYISLEEESTMSPQQGADNPNGEEPRGPRPAEEEAEPSEASSAEWVEEGVPEEPCYYGHGLAWNNRHWRGWKPRETPRMPPKGSVSVDMQQVKSPSDRTQPTGQLQPPSRGIDHEEFCKILNEMPLPYDDAERANFDQQDVFILGDPAASFDRSGSHSGAYVVGRGRVSNVQWTGKLVRAFLIVRSKLLVGVREPSAKCTSLGYVPVPPPQR